MEKSKEEYEDAYLRRCEEIEALKKVESITLKTPSGDIITILANVVFITLVVNYKDGSEKSVRYKQSSFIDDIRMGINAGRFMIIPDKIQIIL